MTPKSEWLPSALQDYMIAFGMPPEPFQADLIDETAKLGADVARLQISPEQGGFLTLLTRLLGVRRAVEVGTFTGYSALCIALGMPAGGRLLCCDVSEEWTSVARRHWNRAGVADRIELRIAPAIETLRALPGTDPIDLVFLDADKDGYIDYWEELVPRVRPGGVLLADNVFSNQDVLNATPGTTSGRAIVAFNAHVRDDPRVEQVMIPIADGLTLARKL